MEDKIAFEISREDLRLLHKERPDVFTEINKHICGDETDDVLLSDKSIREDNNVRSWVSQLMAEPTMSFAPPSRNAMRRLYDATHHNDFDPSPHAVQPAELGPSRSLRERLTRRRAEIADGLNLSDLSQQYMQTPHSPEDLAMTAADLNRSITAAELDQVAQCARARMIHTQSGAEYPAELHTSGYVEEVVPAAPPAPKEQQLSLFEKYDEVVGVAVSPTEMVIGALRLGQRYVPRTSGPQPVNGRVGPGDIVEYDGAAWNVVDHVDMGDRS